MCHALVVQRKLPGFERHLDRLGFVDTAQFLALRQHVVLGEGLDVLHVRPAVRIGQNAHAPVQRIGGSEGDPGGDFFVRGEPEVRGVLVPGHIAWVATVLGEDGRPEEHDVRSDQVLDRIEDARMAPELDEPRKREVALDLQGAVGVVARLSFVGLEARAARGRF